MDKSGEDRDLDCSEPANGRTPPSAKRRDGFTGLLDILDKIVKIKYST